MLTSKFQKGAIHYMDDLFKQLHKDPHSSRDLPTGIYKKRAAYISKINFANHLRFGKVHPNPYDCLKDVERMYLEIIEEIYQYDVLDEIPLEKFTEAKSLLRKKLRQMELVLHERPTLPSE